MALNPEPHTAEWFAALEALNPRQAAHTRQIIESAGRKDVCGVCGDAPASDFKVGGVTLAIRLCDDCRNIRGSMMSENYEPLGPG